MVQDAAGNTYVLPEGGTGAYYVAMQAGPIRSITLDSINDLSNLGVGGDRPVDNFVAPDGVVDGTAGDDTMSLGYNDAAGDVIDNSGNTIVGGGGVDTITAGAGNDTISGTGNDSVLAGDGDDTLIGEFQDDTLTGGDGDDTFIYATGDDADTITDFHAGNTGGLNDGDSTNNDFIDLSARYDHIRELWADQNDDGILNQSNTLDTKGNAVDYSDNDQFGVGDSITFTGAAGDDSFFTVENTAVACFAPGTMIDTPTGPRNIEALSDGDLVLTRDNGPQMIRWIHEDTHAIDGEEGYPILIKAGALGAGLSASDLVVSPQHRILVGEAGQLEHLFDAPTLVPAKSLTTLPGTREMRGKTNITWWHFAFDNHEVVAANGAETESLLLGKIVFMGLPKAERDALLMSFNVDRAYAGVLNGAPARPLPNAGKARRILLENEAALTPGLMRHLHKADDAFVH